MSKTYGHGKSRRRVFRSERSRRNNRYAGGTSTTGIKKFFSRMVSKVDRLHARLQIIADLAMDAAERDQEKLDVETYSYLYPVGEFSDSFENFYRYYQALLEA